VILQRTCLIKNLSASALRPFLHLAVAHWCIAALPPAVSAQTGPQQEVTGGKRVTPRTAPWLDVPYPASDSLRGIELYLSTRRTEAQGSDIWPITWADDGHQYAAYGDGAGFGVKSAREQSGPSRVSLGVSRIEGDWDSYQGVNVWGGKDAENPAQFTGKGTGIICVGGVLYMWVGGPDSRVIEETRLAVSRDHGRTWTLADWRWTLHDRLFAGTFLNFGQNQAGARDQYVYSYFTRIETPPAQPRSWIHETPGFVDLARVPRDRLLDRAEYEWFAGLTEDGNARWTSNLQARQAAFTDPNGIKIVSVCHVSALDRFLLIYNPRDNGGHFALFEAPAPWGPWKQVAYLRDQPLFMPPEPNRRVSVFHFAPKWWSQDGREFTLIFNTGDDAWNTIRGRLLTR
jgi:hypothetical protein